jgi:hypothetical protein
LNRRMSGARTHIQDVCHSHRVCPQGKRFRRCCTAFSSIRLPSSLKLSLFFNSVLEAPRKLDKTYTRQIFDNCKIPSPVTSFLRKPVDKFRAGLQFFVNVVSNRSKVITLTFLTGSSKTESMTAHSLSHPSTVPSSTSLR